MTVTKEFSNFKELINNVELPVLVDFYAKWCGPCHLMSSILEEINPQIKNRIQLVKIDTEKYPNIASEYGIEALPTLVLFKNGEEIERIQGVLQGPQLIQRLETFL